MSTIQAVHARLMKTGATARSAPVAKYNQRLRIAEKLGDRARNAGREVVAMT